MNKDQLSRLQQKVNRLMKIQSDDSDSGNVKDFDINLHSYTKRSTRGPIDIDNQTVRKCVDLIKENKQLKIALEVERREKEQLRREFQRERQRFRKEEGKEKHKVKQQNKKQQKHAKQELEKARKHGRLEGQIEQLKRRNKNLQQILLNERKKCSKLCSFINKSLPMMQEDIDRLGAKLDAKLQQHFIKNYDL